LTGSSSEREKEKQGKSITSHRSLPLAFADAEEDEMRHERLCLLPEIAVGELNESNLSIASRVID
jgi:hypothetical protein